MIRERDKACKIVNLLLEYYALHGFSHINTDITIGDKNTKIVLEGTVDPKSLDLDELKDILQHPRVDEYDDYYDGLLKSSDDQEINSVGFMLDDFSVELNGDILLVKIYREHTI